jgi:nucleoside-diphosphate-sugar epimerase
MDSTGTLNIVFGTGPLGYAVAEELLKKGKSVKMINRSGKADIPIGAKLVQADASDSERTREVCKGAAAVYHCAMPLYTHWPELFPILTYGITEGAAAANAKLIYADNLYAYGSVDEPLTENHPIKPLGLKGQVRSKMAEKLMADHKSGKLKVTIGRASDFYGPRVTVSILGERVFKPAIEGKTISLLGSLDVPHTYTFIKDFARALVLLGENYNAFGEIWNVPSAETITTRELLHLIFNETKRTPKVQTAPSFLIPVISWFNPVVKELREVLPFYEKPYVVNHSKFEKSFGNPSTPHRDAISETVKWYRENYHT